MLFPCRDKRVELFRSHLRPHSPCGFLDQPDPMFHFSSPGLSRVLLHPPFFCITGYSITRITILLLLLLLYSLPTMALNDFELEKLIIRCIYFIYNFLHIRSGRVVSMITENNRDRTESTINDDCIHDCLLYVCTCDSDQVRLKRSTRIFARYIYICTPGVMLGGRQSAESSETNGSRSNDRRVKKPGSKWGRKKSVRSTIFPFARLHATTTATTTPPNNVPALCVLYAAPTLVHRYLESIPSRDKPPRSSY